ncbi:MAG: glycosyltransferase family 2 protein [Gammaproteobacteria bacterium]|nr:glycosyltransferase family 2 protein [Gammaproteobacteria bacterium]
MRFSIVVPLYNKAHVIERTVQSVLAQTERAFELIVVDDGSTDEGATKVEAILDRRVRLLRQSNGGVSRARNAGVAAAQFDWIAFLDADDEWSPEHLSALGVTIARCPEAVAVGTAYRRVDAEGNTRELRLPAAAGSNMIWQISDYFDWSVRFDYPLHCSSSAVRKSALLDIGGFPEEIAAGEDLLTWARLACIGPVALSAAQTAIYYVPDLRAEHRQNNVRRPAQPDRVGAALSELMRVSSGSLCIGAYLAQWYRIRAVSYFELNQRCRCLNEIRQAVKTSGWTRKDVAMLAGMFVPHQLRAKVLEIVRRRKARPPVASSSNPD